MISTLTHSRLAALLVPAAVLMAGPQAPPADAPDADESYQGEAPERYAMVRALEGEVHIRKGDLDETLTRGTPIAEGDVVESRGRGVLQLGDGTRVAFAGATRFTVAALFTDKKGEKQVLLRLDSGRLRVLLGGQSDARFRVDTPSGTATCFDKGGFTIEAERDKVVRLKVHSGRVTFSNERDEARITAGERLTVYSPQDGLDRVRSFNTYDGDDFDRWSDRAVIVQRGESWDRVPAEIRYYADELDNHGRWVHSDEFGWVWQPNGVAEDWRPYYQGRWAPYSGGMTWVSDEPWAYVAYHHGRWHWSVGIGWCWIPGVYYSPAWVAWHHTPGYYGWAPLGYYNTPCHWGYGAWGGGYAWNVVAVTNINIINVNRHIYSDATVLRTFGGGNGGTTWRSGSRDLGTPWQRSPLMVSHAEFRNPSQMETVFRRDVNRDRMQAYERQAQMSTGRVIQRDLSPSRIVPGGAANPGSQRIPFEDRRGRVEAPRGQEVRPIESRRPDAPTGRDRQPEVRRPDDRRLETPQPVQRPDDRSRALPERRPEGAPPIQRPEDRPRMQDRRPDTPPARERMEDRPRPTEAPRPEPAPRERAPEFNFRAPREERRPDPPRSEPARESRPAPRPESRPEPARESRPAPRPEPAREKPREEKKSVFSHEFRR
ncbi:DUF6600 domain-containing protein [Geothrix sp. PMB-07]|uniref:DUF6600 domain-containing protein n=1 Tax=Geothrix sp. PMB-07 TaxID=3068640 RepID=UPI0027406A47|nr:DUF6600 domain-containing protein [Geothrix sp. PMB-07]WLT30744.1 FecR domain-containing protein [Geothrix sp. PMB-07]